MSFPPLVRRRLRRYAEEALRDDTDQAWAALIFAAFKYGKRVKIFDPVGCIACRNRRIADSVWLQALDAGTDATAVLQALRQMHRLPDAEEWLELVISYTGSPVEAIETAAVEQLGRWVDRSVATNRLSFLAQFAKFPSVRFRAKQLLVASGRGSAVLDWLVRNTPTLLRYMPQPGMPEPKDYDAWLATLPRYPIHKAPARPTMSELRHQLAEVDDQVIRGRAEAFGA